MLNIFNLLPAVFAVASIFWTKPSIPSELIALERMDAVKVQTQIYPAELAQCRGVAVLSHGAGGSSSGFKGLAQSLAKAGWLTLVPNHSQSGTAELRKSMRQSGFKQGLGDAVTNPALYQNRFDDIQAVLDWVGNRCPDSPKLLLGHSMGAATTMIEAGAANLLDLKAQDRFDVYVAISPQGVGRIFPAGAWSALIKPVMTITGTRDSALEGDWTTRQQAFDGMPAHLSQQFPQGCKREAVIQGASHFTLVGHGVQKRHEALVAKLVLDYLSDLAKPTCSPPQEQAGVQFRSK